MEFSDKGLPQVGENRHLKDDRAAKYILISFTRSQEEYFDLITDKGKDENGGKGNGKDNTQNTDTAPKPRIVKNNVIINEDYIRRMIASTHYSKVPVEVMVTNAGIKLDLDLDVDVDLLPIRKINSNMGVLPTFKTGVDSSQYMAEPLVVYMKYETFMDILVQLLYKDAWEKYKEKESSKAWAKYFRGIYKQ